MAGCKASLSVRIIRGAVTTVVDCSTLSEDYNPPSSSVWLMSLSQGMQVF